MQADHGRRYSTSKLILLYAVRELASMQPVSETGVTINFISPGLCFTELTRHVGLIPQLIIGTMRRLLGRTAEEGSRTLLHAAVAGKESHGKYLSECEIRE
jgi:NAD(P)-dependent dehydrogenase (short-subunit alcohol dehydrogenase family)